MASKPTIVWGIPSIVCDSVITIETTRLSLRRKKESSFTQEMNCLIRKLIQLTCETGAVTMRAMALRFWIYNYDTTTVEVVSMNTPEIVFALSRLYGVVTRICKLCLGVAERASGYLEGQHALATRLDGVVQSQRDGITSRTFFSVTIARAQLATGNFVGIRKDVDSTSIDGGEKRAV
ncbi:hypothetical protein OG21DRAFT_1526077 [Imleria badia]|nr:hypothetical protein OG21DRAFT_1526077 [Imleria badia]